MVKYRQLYHNIKNKIKKYILHFFRKIEGKKVLEEIIKKRGNINGIKESENGIP